MVHGCIVPFMVIAAVREDALLDTPREFFTVGGWCALLCSHRSPAPA